LGLRSNSLKQELKNSETDDSIARLQIIPLFIVLLFRS